jgi:nicastrin
MSSLLNSATMLVVLLFHSALATNSILNRPFTSSFYRLQHAACVSLYTRLGKQGCGTSSRDIQAGELHLYKGEGSLSSNTVFAPYVALLPEEQLSKEAIEDILSNNKKGYLQGILVTNSSSNTNLYSPAPRSPNGKRTPSQALNYGNSAYGWNSKGDYLLQLDFKGVPLALILDREVSDALISESGKDVTAEFNYYMGPVDDVDSFRCLSWKDTSDGVWRPKCLPLGGQSVWSSVLENPPEGRRHLENANGKQAFFLTSNMDANGLFHDAMPAANEAASNILSILMASKLIGQAQFNQVTKIVVAIFQGEAFGFLGSRRFLKDIQSFSCNTSPVSSVAKNKTLQQACLEPLRPNLEFTNILGDSGSIAGMLSVDQVGILAKDKNLFVQSDGSKYGDFLSSVMQSVAANGYTVSENVVDADDDHFNGNDVTIPPTPLTSLLSLTGGAKGGAVLTGYAETFTAEYGSHRDSIWYQDINFEAIATAATILARTAVAAASDDGSLDADSASSYALQAIPDALAADNKDMLALAECLFKDGNCPLLLQYANVEASTESKKTGLSIVAGNSLGSPPNYYTSVFTGGQSQPFVTVNSRIYGSYIGEDYGKHDSDAFSVQPSLLENSLRGILNDYLGRPSATKLKSCKKTSDCNKVSYCSNYEVVCTGGHVCVCHQAHFHLALDEAIVPATGNYTGYFLITSDDEEISALYTEPYWDGSVGVKVFRKSSMEGSIISMVVGMLTLAASIVATLTIKRTLVKEKLY